MAFNAKSLANLDAGRAKGRKGVLNKTTASVKNALCEAFEQLGGTDALIAWGRKEPTLFYQLWAKMLPAEVRAEVNVIDERTPAERLEAVVVLLRAAGLMTAQDVSDVSFEEKNERDAR